MHNLCTLNPSINKTNTHNNTTLNPQGVDIFEVEDNKEEEDLVVEEAKSYVIIVDNQYSLLGTA